MSLDRPNNKRPLKPTIATIRAPRTPLSHRAATTTPSTTTTTTKTPSTTRSELPRVTPRVKCDDTTGTDALSAGNVTPRSSARKVRAGSATPTQLDDDTPSIPRPRSLISVPQASIPRTGSASALEVSGGGAQQRARVGRPKSVISDSGVARVRSPSLVRSSRVLDLPYPKREESSDRRFFHASEARKPEPAVKKPELKKTPAFFYANEKQEERKKAPSRATSPVLSAVSQKRSSGPWIRADNSTNPSRSPPLLSPALSSLSSASPFFAAATGQQRPSRSPSPSKENIHLSYRKGASQIFGTRPSPRPSIDRHPSTIAEEGRGVLNLSSNNLTHKRSPSLSSIDSGNSNQSRRRSATTIDVTPSPLIQEYKPATVPRVTRPTPSIDTSIDPPGLRSPSLSALISPTKSVSELAADARRERKVLDLEISNSSLLAINASLEREVRRQKSELKRFRRLSRSGRFSHNPNERAARFSEGLSTLGEELEVPDAEYSAFGPPSGFTDVYDDFSEEEDDDDGSESVTSSGAPLSPEARDDQLAKDEKRLRVDLEKHKELLVQSQMVNQSIKRCMFATEEMIKDGNKALRYHVRVADVKLGGRILTGHEDEESQGGEEVVEDMDFEVEDETLHGDVAEDFLKVWRGVGRPTVAFDGSEGGDRDSGIEVDHFGHGAATTQQIPGASESGRPPDERESSS